MLEYLGLVYKDSDNTTMIAIIAILLECTLRLPLAVQLLGKTHKDSDHINRDHCDSLPLQIINACANS